MVPEYARSFWKDDIKVLNKIHYILGMNVQENTV